MEQVEKKKMRERSGNKSKEYRVTKVDRMGRRLAPSYFLEAGTLPNLCTQIKEKENLPIKSPKNYIYYADADTYRDKKTNKNKKTGVFYFGLDTNYDEEAIGNKSFVPLYDKTGCEYSSFYYLIECIDMMTENNIRLESFRVG